MNVLDNLTAERRKLILHRISCVVAEKLQRQDVLALYSFAYLDATLHREHNAQLGPQELREAVRINQDMILQLLAKIQDKRGFDWFQVVSEILQEEGIPQPTQSDATNIALMFVGEAVS